MTQIEFALTFCILGFAFLLGILAAFAPRTGVREWWTRRTTRGGGGGSIG